MESPDARRAVRRHTVEAMAYQQPQQSQNVYGSVTPAPAGQAIKWVLGILAVLFACLLGLISLLIVGVDTGPVGLLIGMILATMPVPIYVLLALWLDRYEPEPPWMLAAA